MYVVTNLPKYLVLGNQGEKNVTSLEFNVAEWRTLYPTGTISISLIRPGETEAEAYPPLGLSLVGNTLTWLVDDVDTAINGRGSFSLNITTGSIIKKSPVVTVIVLENQSITGTPPSGITQWLIQATSILGAIQSDQLNSRISGTTPPVDDASYVGQLYIDTVAQVGYLAVQVGTGASDWKQITQGE